MEVSLTAGKRSGSTRNVKETEADKEADLGGPHGNLQLDSLR